MGVRSLNRRMVVLGQFQFSQRVILLASEVPDGPVAQTGPVAVADHDPGLQVGQIKGRAAIARAEIDPDHRK
jgi:hypothetical protein